MQNTCAKELTLWSADTLTRCQVAYDLSGEMRPLGMTICDSVMLDLNATVFSPSRSKDPHALLCNYGLSNESRMYLSIVNLLFLGGAQWKVSTVAFIFSVILQGKDTVTSLGHKLSPGLGLA